MKETLQDQEGFITIILDKNYNGTYAVHTLQNGEPKSRSHRIKLSQSDLSDFIQNEVYYGTENFSKLVIAFEEGINPSTERVANELANDFAYRKYMNWKDYSEYGQNEEIKRFLSVRSISELKDFSKDMNNEETTKHEFLHAKIANTLLPENSQFQFKPSSELEEKAKKLLKDDFIDWKNKLINMKTIIGEQKNVDCIEINPEIPNRERYTGDVKKSYILNCQDADEQITYINQVRTVEYIGMKGDATLHQGIKRANAYMEWAAQAEQLGYEPQVHDIWKQPLSSQINPALLNTDKRTQGHLDVGKIYFKDAIDMAKMYPESTLIELKKHQQTINEALSTISYDLKSHTVSNKENIVQIPYEAWTNYYEKGLISATEGKLEHVGGYIASMANIKEIDAKKLLTPAQMKQYNESIAKKVSLIEDKGINRTSGRSRERGSSLGR